MKYMNKQEQGFASIVIVLTLVLILALTAVGFAQLARHEQQQALNKQLATQAYYAAETGINDTVKRILAGTLTTSNTSCAGTGKTIDSSNGVSYTCVLVNLNPNGLSYDVDNGPGSHRAVLTSSAGPIDKITFTWTSKTGRTGAAPSISAAPFPTASNWNATYPAVIQLGITPLTSYTRAELEANTYTAFLYPTSAAGSLTYGGAQGRTVGGNCASDPVTNVFSCHVDIDLSSKPATSVFLNFINVYDKSKVDITAYSGGTKVTLQGSQAIIDVTGKAQDVLKRLQVHVPLTSPPALPNYAIEAQNICKRMIVAPTSVDNPNGTTYVGTGGAGTVNTSATNPCNLSN